MDALVRAIDLRGLSTDEVVHLVEAAEILLGSGSLVDLTSVRTESLLRMLATGSREQFDAVAARPRLRELVLDEAVTRIPERLIPARAGALRAVVHWQLSGGPDGPDTVQIAVADGRCASTRKPDADPDVTLATTMGDALRIVGSRLRAAGPILTRRARVRGDLGLALRLVRCFDLSRG